MSFDPIQGQTLKTLVHSFNRPTHICHTHTHTHTYTHTYTHTSTYTHIRQTHTQHTHTHTHTHNAPMHSAPRASFKTRFNKSTFKATAHIASEEGCGCRRGRHHSFQATCKSCVAGAPILRSGATDGGSRRSSTDNGTVAVHPRRAPPVHRRQSL